MSGKRRLEKSFGQFSNKKVDKTNQYIGLLGLREDVVEVPNRNGYCYVRLRDNLSEIVQAFNDKVLNVYNLPVVIEFVGGEYRVVGRDLDRYAGIGWQTTSPYLPKHGDIHSRSPTGGGDVVWVYGNQFLPLMAVPSGSNGANNVLIYDYSYYFNEWKYFPFQGTENLLTNKPTGGNSAKLGLLYLDEKENTYGLNWRVGEIAATLVDYSDIVPLLPGLSASYHVPIAGIWLVTGTSKVLWNNLYDVRPFYSVFPTGTMSGAGGVDLSGFSDGSVLFVETETAQEDNDNFFWDDASNTLLLGNNDISRVITSGFTDLASHKETYSVQEWFSVGEIVFPIFVAGKARGTYASKEAIQADDIIFRLSTSGWDDSGSWVSKARFDVIATENWSSTARGTMWQFRTTAISGTDTRSIFEILGGSVNIMKALQFDNIQAVSTEYRATTEDCVIDFTVDAVQNDLYLPSASGNQQILFIHINGDPEDLGLNIYAQVGETVNGERPKTIYGEQQSITLISDGVDNWISVSNPVSPYIVAKSLDLDPGTRKVGARTVYFDYTLGEDEALYISAVSGSVTVLLPNVSGSDRVKYYVKRIDEEVGNTVMLSGTIDYEDYLFLDSMEAVILIASDENSSWFVH